MKRILIAAAIAVCLGLKIGQAAAVDVSLEWMELDCTKCPELAARFRGAAVQKCDASFADLEKKAGKHVLVRHDESIEPGTTVKQETRVNETTLRIELTIRSADKGAFLAVVHASMDEGPESDDLKPGTQLTPEQMKGIDTNQAAFQVSLSPGEMLAIGGFARHKPRPEKRTFWDALTGAADGKETNDSTIRILVVGIKAASRATSAPQAPVTSPNANPYGSTTPVAAPARGNFRNIGPIPLRIVEEEESVMTPPPAPPAPVAAAPAMSIPPFYRTDTRLQLPAGRCATAICPVMPAPLSYSGPLPLGIPTNYSTATLPTTGTPPTPLAPGMPTTPYMATPLPAPVPSAPMAPAPEAPASKMPAPASNESDRFTDSCPLTPSSMTPTSMLSGLLPPASEPMGFTMHFHVGGNFDAAFEMNVTQGQAKKKTSSAKKQKSSAARAARAHEGGKGNKAEGIGGSVGEK